MALQRESRINEDDPIGERLSALSLVMSVARRLLDNVEVLWSLQRGVRDEHD